MQPPHCDVIGCREAATWQRSVTLVGNFSEFLCELHHGRLEQTRPLVAGHYTPMEDNLQSAQQAQPERKRGTRTCLHLAVTSLPSEQPGSLAPVRSVAVDYCTLVGEAPRSVPMDGPLLLNGPDGEPVDRETCTILRYEQRCRPEQLAHGPKASGDRGEVVPGLDTGSMDLRSQLDPERALSRLLRIKARRVRRDARLACYHGIIRRERGQALLQHLSMTWLPAS